MRRGTRIAITAPMTRYASAERIGARVRAIRESQKMTTTEFAKKTGFSQQQICAVELGRINTPVETLARLAEGLGVDLAELFVHEHERVLLNDQTRAAFQALAKRCDHAVTTASYLAMTGANSREIQEVLGHKNINQTARYTHLTTEHTAGVLQRMIDHFLTGVLFASTLATCTSAVLAIG